MPIRFRCPACHRPFIVVDRLAGKKSPCPACQASLTIPTKSDPDEFGPLIEETPGESSPTPPDFTNRPRQLHRTVLAGALVGLMVGLAVGIPLALPGKEPSPELSLTQPSSQNDEPKQTPAAQPAETKPSQPQAPAEPAAKQPGETASRPAVTPTVTPTEKRALQTAEPPKQAAARPAPQEAAPVAKPAAPAAEVKQPEGVRERWAAKRRSKLTDEDLRRQLLLPTEVDLNTVPGTSKRIISQSGKAAGTGIDIVPQFVAQRADLVGLPLHTGTVARTSVEEALNLKVLSQRLRLVMQSALPAYLDNVIDPRPDPEILRQRLLNNPQQGIWLRPQAISTLRQLLMFEHRNVRLVLVELLSQIEGRLASMALAERAVFDLDPDVRLTALVALKGRPAAEYEALLLNGFRYPWPPVADHAAEALVALHLRDAVPKLITMLDVREISEPYVVGQGQTRHAVIPELVRVNHLKNCLLCHAYSGSPGDPVRGLVPNGNHLVPLPATGARTVTGPQGKWTEGPTSVNVSTPTFVRADITFFRQDFSVQQPVANHGRLWPSDQRFDYLVRLRPLSHQDLVTWQDKLMEFRTTSPQRESLLYALRELSSDNPGPAAEDWLRAYSPITGQRLSTPLTASSLVQHLMDCLLEGSPLQQAERLALFEEKSGSAYDKALSLTIPQLNATLQKSARGVLTDRFYCLPIKTLAEKLRDADPEYRRAGVTVAKQRRLKSLVPELIDLLDDANIDIAKQAHQILYQFASRDLGPRPGADQEAKLEAMRAWRDWWEQQVHKKATAQKGS